MYHLEKKVEDQGESITLNNTAKTPFEIFKVEGNSVQEGEPTPEAPIAIQNVEGNIDITVCNKNLFNKNNANVLNAYISANKLVSESQNRIIWIPCKSNVTYTASKKAGQRFAIYFSENEPAIGVTISGGTSDNTASTLTSTSLSDSKYIVIYVANYNVGTEIPWQDILDSLQIEENPTATEYIENQQQAITFPLQEGQKLMKGDYLADDGIHHKRKQFEVDGTNLRVRDIFEYTNGLYYCTVTIPFISINKSDGYSTHFKWLKQGIVQINCCYVTAGGSTVVLVLENQNITTVEDANNWLIQQKQAGTPVIVEYELAEEVIELYTEEQQKVYNKINVLYSYDEVTNVFSNNEVGPILNVITYQRISEEIKQRLLNGKITRAYLKVLATETKPEMIINESNYLKDLTFEELRYVPDEGFIGGTVAKRVSGNFNNVDNSFSIQDREFELYIGVDLEDETTEYIKYGTYIVQKPEDNQVTDNTSFEALDYMIKLNLPWEDRMIYPCTLKQLFDDLVDQSGLSSKVVSFLNEDFIVENNQFESGTTRRDVLKAIAQMAFNWTRIDENNNIVMDFEKKDTIDETLTVDNYYNFSKQEVYGPINVIVLRNSQVEGENITIRDEESIAEYGEIEFVISDNPFAYTQEKRAELIEAGRSLFGLTYIPMSMDMIGYIYLNCKDKIRTTNFNNENFDTYLLNHTIEYTGVVSDSMETPASTKTETKYQFTPDMIKQIKHTELKVDKANQEIVGIIEKTDETNKKLVEIKATTDSIKSSISNVESEISSTNGEVSTIKTQISEVEQKLDGITTNITNTGGNNLIRNSVGIFDNEFWEGKLNSYTDTEIQNNTVSGNAIMLQNSTLKQNILVKNGIYNISFIYKKLINLANCKIIINDLEIELTDENITEIEKSFQVTNNSVNIEIISDTNNSCYISDLLLLIGEYKQTWTQNQNETVTDTVKIGQGIEVTSSKTNTKLLADSDGVRINNVLNNNTIAEFTDKGTTTENLIVKNTAQISGLLVQKIGEQVCFNVL